MHSHPPSKPPFGGSRDGEVGTTSIREEPERLSTVGLTDMEGRKPRGRQQQSPTAGCRAGQRAIGEYARAIMEIKSTSVVGTSGSLPLRSVWLHSSSRPGPNRFARGPIALEEREEKSSASRRTGCERRLCAGYRHFPRLGPGFVRIPAELVRDQRHCFGRADGGFTKEWWPRQCATDPAPSCTSLFRAAHIDTTLEDASAAVHLLDA
jgi:hypothetical protein